MKSLRWMLAGVILCAMAVAVRADDKKPDKPSSDKADYAKLVVGTWEATKVDSKDKDNAPVTVGSIAEFTKDGKIKATVKRGAKEEVHEATYKVDGDKITLTVPKTNDSPEKNITLTIKKLNDSELTIVDDEGNTIEWKRKKGS